MMNIPIDIHTHRLPATPGEAIVNRFLRTDNECTLPDENWYSAGIHPWHITDDTIPTLLLQEGGVPEGGGGRKNTLLAIGEAGLDKLASTPLALQMTIFEKQARLAEQLHKPLIIHLVRATDELLQIKKKINPAMPWIIHGFRGKPALAEVYLKQGFYLSFGEKYREETLRTCPIERLLMETDESPLPIRELYARAAQVRDMKAEELLQSVRENVKRIFFAR